MVFPKTAGTHFTAAEYRLYRYEHTTAVAVVERAEAPLSDACRKDYGSCLMYVCRALIPSNLFCTTSYQNFPEAAGTHFTATEYLWYQYEHTTAVAVVERAEASLCDSC